VYVNVTACDLEKFFSFDNQVLNHKPCELSDLCVNTPQLNTLYFLCYGYYKGLKHQKWSSVRHKVGRDSPRQAQSMYPPLYQQESYAIAHITARCHDKSKQTASSHSST